MKTNTILQLFFCLFFFQIGIGQEIEGIVLDESNLPLPGANVLEKGTSNGTQTDFDGRFKITLQSNKKALIISYIGYITQKINLKKQSSPIKVIMQPDHSSLEEVVVTGMGIKRVRKSIGYAVSTVPAESFFSNEGYAEIEENGFLKANKKPLSTFSVDVDAASYSNMRRFLNEGQLPPKNAVRIEEMINYFNYDYPNPNSELPFSVTTELATCPWNDKNLLLHVGLQGKKLALDKLPPSNIVFLLDVSGSMKSYNKLPLVKKSLTLLLDSLGPKDKVAIVVYAGSSGLILPSTTCDDKEKILSVLDNLSAGGSTAGGQGLKLAYKIAEENFIEKGNNRIIMATDGDFNVGLSSNSEMETLITKQRDKGIFISVLGFGMGNYQDDKMEIIADKGNGNYAYIDNLLEAKKVLVSEFGGTFHTIAKDVKFQLEFNPYLVSEYRLVGYENRLLEDEDFDNDQKDAGDIGSGHSVTALYEIIPNKKKVKKSKNLKYQESVLTAEALTGNDIVWLKLRYKSPKKNRSEFIELSVENSRIELKNTSENFRFSAAVAQFGMLLRNSKYLGKTTWQSTISLAKQSKGIDKNGYRSEMIRLVESAELIEKTSKSKSR
ncbi:vWA domain-containing protein [Sediminicola luteus]|uniref:VWFA domain-containing protein n=1 Tax=Sediminicola luteus TaxID=319238 RepID=A0A2A4GEJ1_9FLAO|nr:VWA domain-containing protein [Sediminicola luteus]PCE66400.1 hypothetical protein B7P33_03645 [Sediminicola luteus]